MQTLVIGNVITMDQRFPSLEALVAENGIIKYIGNRHYAEKLCDKDTVVLDYGNNYIYPGFIEGHCHGTNAALRLKITVDLTPGTKMNDYLEIMKKHMIENPDKERYVGAGWEVREKEPTKEMLDEICPDKPMALNSTDGHSLWMNTKALEYYGIDENSVKKWGTSIIRVGKDGKPTGYISEGPTIELTRKINKIPKEDIEAAMLVWQEYALSMGITSYYDAGIMDEDNIIIYNDLIKSGKWKIRVYGGWYIDENSPDIIADVKKAKEMADKYNNEYFQIIGIKIFMDGVVEAETAWLTEDYANHPGHKGIKRFHDFDKTVELYKEANKYGFNVHQHTIGDGAVKFALDCIEKVQLETRNMSMRNALAHLQVVRPEDVKRMADLNVVAVVAPLWMQKVSQYYRQDEELLGQERAFYQYPLKSISDENGLLAFHTDYPVSPLMSMPKTIYSAVERNDPEHGFYTQLNAHEGLDRLSALCGITLGPAYEVNQEYRQGVLRIGYLANMTVFDKDFLFDDINEVAKSKIIATIIDGEEVYRAKN